MVSDEIKMHIDQQYIYMTDFFLSSHMGVVLVNFATCAVDQHLQRVSYKLYS